MQLLEGTLNARADHMYAAAERHYLRGETMEAIAHDLGLSRSSVSRLLRQAREEGMVRIFLEPRGTSSPLAARIAEQFGIEVFLVAVPDSAPPALRFEAVGKRTAQLLTSLMADDMRVGVAWGVTIAQVVRHLEKRPLSGVTVVQMNGSGNAFDTAIPYVGAILSAVADSFSGRVVPLPVPAFFDHAQTKALVWNESMIQRVLAELALLDIALFGIGALHGSVPSRVYSAGYLPSETLSLLEKQGVVGDVNTVLLREDGTFRDIALNERATGMPPDELRRVACRICAVADPLRAAPTVGALRAGVVTHLVCDEATARAVIKRAGRGVARGG